VVRPLQPPSSDLDEDEVVPDSELEFEDLDGVVQNESSDSSSDNFVPEESSESDAPQDQESGAPLRVSMATANTSAHPSSSRAGQSSRALGVRKSTTVADSEAQSSESSDSDDPVVASKKTPWKKRTVLAMRRGRGAAATRRRPPGPRRGRGRRAEDDVSDQESDISDEILEPSDDEAKPPPKGLEAHQTRALIKVAERRMRKKLGRKLTLVRLSPTSPEPPYIYYFSSAYSVTSRQPNSTFSTQSSRVVGEISRRPSPSSPQRRRSSLRGCWSLSYHSNKKAYTG